MPKTKENSYAYEYNANYILCPHCDHKHVDDMYDIADENGSEFECDSCYKKFIATMNIDITYCSDFIEEEEIYE